MLRSFSTKSNSKYHIFPSVKSFGRDIWCIFFLHEVKQEGRIIVVVAWILDFGGDISVAIIGGWRPDDIVSFDAPYQPVNALFHAVPGQPRRGQDHAVPLPNRFSIILKDWFHLSNTHAFWNALIFKDSFFALNPRIQRPFVGPSKGSSWYQSKDFENDEIFPWPRILHKKHIRAWKSLYVSNCQAKGNSA